MYEYGHGVDEADLQEAIKWYRQSVEKGNGYAPALYNLGLMQAYGRGLNQDFSRALLLFQVGHGNYRGSRGFDMTFGFP